MVDGALLGCTCLSSHYIRPHIIMMERERSNVSSTKRLSDYLLPLQVVLLMISGFIVVMQISQLPTSSPSRRLREQPSTLTSQVDPQQRKAAIEDLQKLYEGTKLDKSYVQGILREGRQVLSEYDTVYDLSLPKISTEEDADLSRKGITVSLRA